RQTSPAGRRAGRLFHGHGLRGAGRSRRGRGEWSPGRAYGVSPVMAVVMPAWAVVAGRAGSRRRGAGAGATVLIGRLTQRLQGELQLLTNRLGLVGNLQPLIEHGHRILRIAR